MKEAPFVAVTETPLATAAGVAAAGTFTPCTFGSAGPPNFQAAMTSAVSTHDRGHGDRDEPRLTMLALAPALRRDTARPQRLLVLAGDVAGVVLVDVELAVHPERVRVRAQEALDVGVARGAGRTARPRGRAGTWPAPSCGTPSR